MLNVMCIDKGNGRSTFRVLLSLLTFTVLPVADVFGNPLEKDLIFIPGVALENAHVEKFGVTNQDIAKNSLMSGNGLQHYTSTPVYSDHRQDEGNISDYKTRVFDIETRAGPFASELTEVLHSLGNLYYGQGEYDQALASFAREEHINRVNHGLFSDTLLPAVKSQIHILNENGMNAESNDKQLYLIYLLEKCYGHDDKRLLPDLISYAEWNMNRFNEIVRFEFSDAPLKGFASGYGSEKEYREQAFENLDLASKYYSRAIKLMIDHKQFNVPTLFHLENRLVELAFFQAARLEILADPEDYMDNLALNEAMYRDGPYASLTRDAFQFGVASYERQLAYIAKDPQGGMSHYVHTLMAMGDWYMLFDKPRTGMKKYRKARELMVELNIREASIANVLTPEVPVAIPSFTATPHSLSSVEQVNGSLSPYSGYIDVSFTLNRNGNTRAVEVTASSENTNDNIESMLKKTLKKTRFRPRFQDAEIAREDTVAVRYYYAYQTGPS